MDKGLFKNIFNIERITSVLPLQIFSFVVVGGISFLVDIAFLVLFVRYFDLNVIVATVFCMTISTTVNYLLNIKFVFLRGRHETNIELSLFYVWAALAFLLNLGFMWFFAEFLGIWYVYSRIITIVIISVLNFLIKKKLIFLK